MSKDIIQALYLIEFEHIVFEFQAESSLFHASTSYLFQTYYFLEHKINVY